MSAPAIVRRLNGADAITLAALSAGWTGTLLIVSGEPNWGILALLGACCLDKADGAYARHRGLSSGFGTQIDAFADVSTYLVSASLLFATALSPHVAVSAAVGALILSAGSLRLVRYVTAASDSEGRPATNGGATAAYSGATAFHLLIAVVLAYVCSCLVGVWTPWLSTGVAVAAAPVMLTERPTRATASRYVAAVGICAFIAAACLALELS